ncbi:MAG: PAS domain S-box protein [Prolixibacteraceae bacterium]|nr:PAS domain S-box protein [Prolixibacteraceae bacterium]
MKHKNRYIFIALFIVFSFIVVIGVNRFFNYEKNLVVASQEKELKTIASLKIDQLSGWYYDEINDAKVISYNIYFIKRIREWIKNPYKKNADELQNYIKGLRDEHGYYSLIIFDPALNQTVSTDSILHEPIIHEKVLNRLINSGNISCTGFYKCADCRKVFIDFYAPVYDEYNRTIAYVVFRHDPAQNIFPLIKTWPVPSKSSETLIIRKEADSVLFLNDLRHLENAGLNLKISMENKEVPAVYTAMGNNGFVEGIDYRGAKVLAYTQKIEGTPWYLIAKTDMDEIIENTLFNTKNQMAFSIIILLILFAVLTLIYNLNQKNFYRKLFEAHEEFKTTLYSIGDGVITTNKKGKVIHMNPVAEMLTGWTEKKAIGKDVDVVFVVVNEESLKVVENPVERAIKESEVVNLANHSLLLSADGRKIPIADSGAPVFDETGKVTGAVLVFRDQTTERENQKKLLESQRTMSTLLSNLPGMAYRCKNDPQWTMEFVSSGCLNLTGYNDTEITGNNVISYNDIILPDDRKMVWAEVQRAVTLKQSYTIEYRIMTKRGKVKWVWEKGQAVLDEQGKIQSLEGFINDINERKLFEMALKTSESQFQTLTHNATVGIFRTDSKGRTTYVNPMWCQLSGMSSIESQDMKWTMAIHPDDREKLLNEWAEAVKNKLPSSIEYRFIRPNGNIVWVSGHAVPEFNPEGELLGYIGTIADITPQKEALRLLKESEEKYRLIVQNQSELVVKVDSKKRFQFVSQSYCKMFGKTEEELLGK